MKYSLVVVLILSFATMALGDQYDFRPIGENLGRFMLFGDEVMIHVSGKTNPGRPEFLVWTTTASKGPARLFFDSRNRKRSFLLVDDTKDLPQLLIKENDDANLRLFDNRVAPETVHWNWEPTGTRRDDKVSRSRLRVEQGKFKGWYLAAEPNAVEIKATDGTRTFQARKLKFVQQPEEALHFDVYVVSK